MTAESAVQFEALQAKAQQILQIFAAAGYERVAPAYIQPADIFLSCIGEALRNRTYVFTDPDGQELCLRPDLTVPAAHIYMERNPQGGESARYCYNGAAFRYQPIRGDAMRPREFRQTGLEYYGASDPEAAEVEVLALILEAVRASGLKGFQIHTGDLSLFCDLLNALPIPQRWRERLIHHFWRPGTFSATLQNLARGLATISDPRIAELATSLDSNDRLAAERQVADFLDRENITVLGARNIGEIAERLLSAAADMREAPLSRDVIALVESYLSISGPPAEALSAIEALTKEAGLSLDRAIASCQKRYKLMREADIDLGSLSFDADFGRNLEYYSGFVFQLEIPGKGISGQIAGGGRYDGLLRSIGAGYDMPAVGSAIHTERLLAATGGAG
ncbi:MAG TPA: ATP phosphoribosyltransferase regulatory subunit [Hyphomicrobiales bacterium]|nr:ATP phosphoribosyltransferase regulatory subunit [Hyphomicrobiales bacterium]